MSKHMEFYIQDNAASMQIGKNVYRRVSIPIDDFNAACAHYGFIKERTCKFVNSKGFDYPPTCSACGFMVHTDELFNYCPNCRTKVIGGKDGIHREAARDDGLRSRAWMQ